MDLLRRCVCPTHGETKNLIGMGQGRAPLHADCGEAVEVIEYVPASQLQGAVDLLAEVYEIGVGVVDRTNPDRERASHKLSLLLDKIEPYATRGAVDRMPNIERSELEELRRFKAWTLRDKPEYVKANATLKHRVRELEAELATTRGAVQDAATGRALIDRMFELPRPSPEWEQALAELRVWCMDPQQLGGQ